MRGHVRARSDEFPLSLGPSMCSSSDFHSFHVTQVRASGETGWSVAAPTLDQAPDLAPTSCILSTGHNERKDSCLRHVAVVKGRLPTGLT